MPVAKPNPASSRAAAPRAALTLLLCAVFGAPLFAQQPLIPVNGRLTDAEQQVVVGYRVVFRTGADEILLSPPTDEEGAFRLDVRTGTNCAPIAVVSPTGERLAIEGVTYQAVLPGVRFDIELGIAIRPARDPRPFRGADRLFLSFVEDVAFVSGLRAQAQLIATDGPDASRYVSEFLAAYNWTALPTLEVGGRIGFAGAEFDLDGRGATGPTDLEIWGKYLAGASLKRGVRWVPGAVLTLPTGDADTGLSAEALRLKLFGSARREFGPVTVSANLGLRFNDDAEIDGTQLEGQLAGALGVAALMPFGDRVVGVAEFYYEGKRFEQSEDDGRLLVGANWKALSHGFLRLALGLGLTDGSPDVQFVAGYTFEF
jgi:hypothetical protein